MKPAKIMSVLSQNLGISGLLDFVYSSIFQEKLKKKKKHFGNWV
jgi:hypothetical protein